MQLCDKLCRKFFHSSFGRSDLADHSEIQNVQLISNNKIIENVEQLKIPTVKLIESSPIQSPSKSKSDSRRTSDIHDSADIILEIVDQDNEPQEEIIEREPENTDVDAMELENEKVLSILDKSTEEDVLEDSDKCIQEKSCDNELDEDDKKSIDSLADDGDPLDKGIHESEGFDQLDENSKRLATKYGDMGGELILLQLPNPRLSNCILGLKLSGHKDLNTMGVFICQISPNSLAAIDGRLNVGDEILEVDDHILYGRSHLNVTPIIRACSQKVIRFVIHRSDEWIDNMAIPISYRKAEECNSVSSSRRPSTQESINESDFNQSRKTSTVSLSQMPTHFSISTEEAHIVYLNKSSQGFGFAIMERSFTNEDGIYIKHVAPAGPAAQDGSLHPGDRLISINNQDITEASYETALELLRGCKTQVRLVVTRVRCAHSPTHTASSPVKNLYQKRLSAPHITTIPAVGRSISPTILEERPQPHHQQAISIKTIPESESGLTTLAKTMSDLNARRRSSLSNLPSADVVSLLITHMSDDENVEVVTIDRKNQALGMSIIGGSDTFIGDIIVHDIFSKGVIANDGRIKVGDRIIMINEISVIDKTNEEVLILLQSSCPEVTLKIRHPDSPILYQDIYEVVTTVELLKKPTKGLGISIVGREGAKGVYIYDVVKGGVADADGRLQPGDQILEINGDDFRNSTQEDTATTLKFLMGTVIFKIGRIQKMNYHYTPTYLLTNEDSGDTNKLLGKHLAPNGQAISPSRSNLTSPAHAR